MDKKECENRDPSSVRYGIFSTSPLKVPPVGGRHPPTALAVQPYATAAAESSVVGSGSVVTGRASRWRCEAETIIGPAPVNTDVLVALHPEWARRDRDDPFVFITRWPPTKLSSVGRAEPPPTTVPVPLCDVHETDPEVGSFHSFAGTHGDRAGELIGARRQLPLHNRPLGGGGEGSSRFYVSVLLNAAPELPCGAAGPDSP